MDKISFEELLEKYLLEDLTTEEQALFFEQLRLPENEASLTLAMQQNWHEETFTPHLVNEAVIRESIKTGLLAEIQHEPPVVRLKGIRSWGKWVAAAAFIGIIASAVILNIGKDAPDSPAPQVVVADVAPPAGSRAVISLADGTMVALDSLNTRLHIQQEGVRVLKNEAGEIVYQQVGESAGRQLYNTLLNPRGSQVVNLSLSDGTRVWLNAASSLKYPVSFLGESREVEITGEAYFEVAKDRSKRFIVRGGGVTTEVLGTHFNVNNYADDGVVRVTLLKGKVKTSAAGGSVLLSPGQQAQAGQSVKKAEKVDLEEVMAWKNGAFSFKGTSIASLLQELSRWYDIEVIYEGEVPKERITGEVKRDASLSQVLKMLEFAGIEVRLEGKKIIVGK